MARKTETIEEVETVAKTYVLADGFSITTLAGIKIGGQEIEAKYFKDVKTFEDLKTKNIIIEKEDLK